MEHNRNEPSVDKNRLNKAKSQCSDQVKKVEFEPAKRKSFNANEAGRFMDVPLSRLKKSKLVNGESIKNAAQARAGRNKADGMLITNSMNMADVANTSLMSMNFSHYELMRNVSHTNNSDSAFSNTASDILSAADTASRNEQLERYFQSMEMWSGNNQDAGSSSIRDGLSDK